MPNHLRIIIIFLCTIIAPASSFAWSNYFRFINNFDKPLTFSIQPTLATVNNPCGGLNNIEVMPHSVSCELEFTTEKENFWDDPANNGTITVALKNDPQSYCTYHYDYTYTLIPYSFFKIYSENIILQSCQGNLQAKEISVVNDHNNALPRSLAGDIILGLDQMGAAKSTESFSDADCGGLGGNNCMIVAPNLTTLYKNNGSSLWQALSLQNHLDQYEPLNFSQFIGSHNAAISSHYTTSNSSMNMSYSDPDNYLSLTEQLNAGVRQIELDIEWYNNAVTICHNHVDGNLKDILCDGNATLASTIAEIKTWVEKNPQELLILYLDVNLPLDSHVNDLDNDLAQLEPHVFTPSLAKEHFKVDNNTLPAYQLSKNSLIHQFQKNIIITNDDDVENLKTSKYVFVNVQNSTETPLAEVSANTFLSKKISCNDKDKYSKTNKIFNDVNHYNIFRINEDRTVINYMNSAGDSDPNQYMDYFTTQNINNILNCPVNILSTNMLGFGCNDDECTINPTDPRLYNFLWSWGLGYPLVNNGSTIAYINPVTQHFENDTLIPNSTYSVLCYHPSHQPTPDALDWFIKEIKISDTSQAAALADKTCKESKGLFVTPTTSYWMNDVMDLTQGNNNKILINYQFIKNDWVPNNQSPS